MVSELRTGSSPVILGQARKPSVNIDVFIQIVNLLTESEPIIR